MNKVILIAIVLVAGWYGNILYKQNKFSFLQDTETTLDLGEKTKCITKDGRVLYGIIPEGTICERREPVEGSITIVPGETISAGKGNNK